MADLSQLEKALVKADAAGDADGARLLASEIRKMRAPKSELPGLVNYNPGAGIVEGALSLGTGAFGSVAGGISGMATGATNALGLTNTPAGDRVRQVSEALTYQPRTAAGKALLGGVSAPFEALAHGADAAGGAVTDVTGSPLVGAGVNTAIQAAPMLLGRGAGAVPGESAASIAARARAKVANAPGEATLAAARESGLKLTPQDANAGGLVRGVAGLSGEPKLAKLMSKKNAPTVNDMIRRDVGLPDDVPLSRDALAAIRKEEGKAYEAVKNTGRLDTDAKYAADLQGITRSFDTAAKDFAHRSENPFKKTMEGLNVKSMDAASAVEEVKLLRGDADKAYRAGDRQLGGAYKDAANVLDNMLDRHLKKVSVSSDGSGIPGMTEGVARYQEARKRIAKTYAADKALNEATGNIDAAVYAKARRDGVPLTGEAKKVADFATAFPRSLQRTERIGATGPTYFDFLLGGAGGIMGTLLGGAPGLAAIGVGASRPLARSALASESVQNAITAPRSYGPSRLRTLQDILQEIGGPAGTVGVTAGQ